MVSPGAALRCGLLVLACGGCDAELCREELGATPEISASDTGELRLSDEGDDASLRFEAALRGLPELWPSDSAIESGRAELRLALAYEEAPFGSDGKTQMPVLEVGLSPSRGGAPAMAQTPEYPLPSGATFAFPLFDTCEVGGSLPCCVYGARDCVLPVEVRLERLEGTPFPPVLVAWELEIAASVATCPEPSRPELTLSASEP